MQLYEPILVNHLVLQIPISKLLILDFKFHTQMTQSNQITSSVVK